MIDKEQALEIIDRRDFFNDRGGRELWNDKPKDLQDEDILSAHEDYAALKEYILNRPKVGKTADPVNHPSHYTHGKYEPIEVIADWGLDFDLGNVIKYIARCEYKGNKLQDLKKAQMYLNHEIERLVTDDD